MFFLIGFFVVFGSVIGGYVLHHGNLAILWQPSEFLIIFGASIGSFIIGNPTRVTSGVVKNLKLLFKKKPFTKSDYLELLMFLLSIFKTIKSKGMLAIENDIENPGESEIFKNFPHFCHHHHAVEFFCEYIRLINMGMENPYQLEDLMVEELDAHHKLDHDIPTAIVTMGDGMPALGIVAAVLGVITTMGSITEPPEVLGGLIGAALVGTFTGVLASYGLISPMGSYIDKYMAADGKYMECIKAAIVAYAKGSQPMIILEFARKAIPHDVRPSFQEVEMEINNMNG